MPNPDDRKQALELLQLGREYLVGVFALAIVRADALRRANDEDECYPSNTIRELEKDVSDSEQSIIDKIQEHHGK